MVKCGRLALVGIFTCSPLVQADCITLNTSAWTQDQKNLMQAVAYGLVFKSGVDSVPNITRNTICVTDPSVNVNVVLSQSAMEGGYSALQSMLSANAATQKSIVDTANTELGTNGINSASLSTIDSQIDAISDLNGVKVFLKMMARYLVAKRVSGQ